MKGELYEVDNKTLQNLDILEEVPTLYTREYIHLRNGQKAWTYFFRPQPAQAMRDIPNGDYFSVCSDLENGRK